MWVLIVLMILVYGYMYISQDPILKYKLKKSDGWKSYFIVAEQGITLLISSAGMLIFTGMIIVFFMMVVNLPYKSIGDEGSLVEFRESIANTIVSILDVLISLSKSRNFTQANMSIAFLVFTFIYVSGAAKNLKDKYEKEEHISEAAAGIGKLSQVESMILEAVNSGLLIMVTLNSRKTYVGQVLPDKISYTDSDSIIIIPILSGYRDRHTLSFIVENDYAEYYAREEIDQKSNPSKSQFQQVLFFKNIDTISLFNTDTYKKFKESGKNISFDGEDHY